MPNRKRKKQEDKPKVQSVEGKTVNQKDYIKNILNNDIVFCTGPAGCGKSYIAAGMAAELLHRGLVNNIIVTRPLVCTGKDIGSLPGEVSDKIDPYLRPMKKNLMHFLGRAYYGHFVNNKQITYEPLELMRGETFNNTCMILDEAQNCTFEQLEMYATRIGEDSKVLINGDDKQSDLRKGGLIEMIELVSDVEGVAVTQLEIEDIQRHGIVGRFLTATSKRHTSVSWTA